MLGYLKERVLSGDRLFTSDKCIGLIEVLGEHFPKSAWHAVLFTFIAACAKMRHTESALMLGCIKSRAPSGARVATSMDRLADQD